MNWRWLHTRTYIILFDGFNFLCSVKNGNGDCWQWGITRKNNSLLSPWTGHHSPAMQGQRLSRYAAHAPTRVEKTAQGQTLKDWRVFTLPLESAHSTRIFHGLSHLFGSFIYLTKNIPSAYYIPGPAVGIGDKPWTRQQCRWEAVLHPSGFDTLWG